MWRMLYSIADYKDRVTGDVLNLLNQGVKTICGFGETVYDKFTSFIGSIFGSGGKKTASGGDGHSFGGGSRSFGGGGANTIKVSTEEMAATIAKYQSEKGRLMEAVSVCNNAAQLLARSWAGPSFLAMSVQMANTYKNLYQSINRVDDAIDELKKTIGIMENTEKNVKASAVSLDIGTSPFA